MSYDVHSTFWTKPRAYTPALTYQKDVATCKNHKSYWMDTSPLRSLLTTLDRRTCSQFAPRHHLKSIGSQETSVVRNPPTEKCRNRFWSTVVLTHVCNVYSKGDGCRFCAVGYIPECECMDNVSQSDTQTETQSMHPPQQPMPPFCVSSSTQE